MIDDFLDRLGAWWCERFHKGNRYLCPRCNRVRKHPWDNADLQRSLPKNPKKQKAELDARKERLELEKLVEIQSKKE